jgi:hypothetical protein
MWEVLPWAVLIYGLACILASTLLFPLIRPLNHWFLQLLGWYGRRFGWQGLPLGERFKTFAEWWLAREWLQRLYGTVTGLVLVAVWWFIWGVRLA